LHTSNLEKKFHMNPMQKSQITECARCGTCCMKGGPALHDEDIRHIDSGGISLSALFTIRKGELAHDNVNANGGLIRLSSEIIKIKSLPDSSVCIYFNDADMSCEVYGNRPIECRTLECWNTRGIKKIYARNRLNRKEVLKNISWLLELVTAHESECRLDKIQALVNAREAGDTNATSALMEMVNYDFHYRNLVMEKGKIIPEILDFLFGRPLPVIISAQFGVKIEHAGID